MLHRAVARRNGNVPAKVAIGFSKHHFFKRILLHLLHQAAPSRGEDLSDAHRLFIRGGRNIFRSSALSRPRWASECGIPTTLEQPAAAHLAPAHRVRRSDDSDRRGTDSGAVSSRRIQAHDVEDVVSVCTDLETKTCPETVQANVARDREIHVLERRPAHQVAAGASIYGYSVDQSRRILRERSDIEPLCRGAR